MDQPTGPDEALVELIRSVTVRAVVSDVDGTLTDGSLYTSSDGQVMRRFTTLDGMGHNILHGAGVKLAWLSATSEGGSVARRAEMLRVEHVDTGAGDKGPRFARLCEAMGVDEREALYVGDDINDLPAMRRAPLSFCPADAHPIVRRSASYTLPAPGGHGAFRILADAIVAALGKDPTTLI